MREKTNPNIWREDVTVYNNENGKNKTK